jgi:protein TonB
MRSALLISITLHVAVAFSWFRLVKINEVRFVPREVYTVRLVSPAAAKKPTVVAPVPEQKPEPVVQEQKPEPKPEEKKDEMPAPPEKPKPKAKSKDEKKIIPTADIKHPAAAAAAAADSAAGADADGPLLTGDVSLDGQDFPFAYYVTTMKRKIAALWEVPGGPSMDSRYCQVYFRVLRNGSIQSPSIETSSGNFLFDQAAVRAVVQASPLPALPAGFSDEYLGVHFSFTYERK